MAVDACVLYQAAAVTVVGALCVSAFAAGPSGDVLAGLKAQHPRLLFTKADQKRVEALAKTDPLLGRLVEQVKADALAALDAPPLRRELRDGVRLLFVSRECIGRVLGCAMAYRLTGEKRFADHAAADMLAACGFSDWNPGHTLDTAELAAALAIGYDWLYDALSPADRAAIRKGIVEKAFVPCLKHYKGGHWWSRSTNNWNQVCNGGFALAALAVAEDEPALAADVLARAVKSLPRAMSVYNPDGCYPEGPGYWEYGTTYNVVMLRALQTALGHDFELAKSPGFEKAGEYIIHATGPAGLFFNYADGGEGAPPAVALFGLAALYDRPFYAARHRRQLEAKYPPGRLLKPGKQDRFFALEIAWYDPRQPSPAQAALPPDALLRGDQDVLTFRSAWDDPAALYAAFKAGDNKANHAHLDIGSFVLDAAGVRWASDLGGDNYNLPGYWDRGGKRWDYFRLGSASHNTLTIGGANQHPDARAKVLSFFSRPAHAGGVIDMTAAYAGQASRVHRGLALLDRRAVLVQDEITGAKSPIRWAMLTRAEIALDGPRATLTLKGKKLTAEILSPAGATFAVASTKPKTKAENPNDGTSLLTLTIPPDKDGLTRIAVFLQPMGRAKPQAAPEMRSLKEWK